MIGDVSLGRDDSVWFNAVVRGDVNAIRIGAATNIQDGSVLHVTHRAHPLDIGEGVVVGHGAILHGCRVEGGSMIGIGSRVLDGAVVEAGAQVAAGAVVTPGKRIPAGWVAMGVPARPVRKVAEDERDRVAAIVERYVALGKAYGESLGKGYGSSSGGVA